MPLGEFDFSEIEHPVSTDHGLEKPVVQFFSVRYTLQSMLSLHESRYIYDERTTEASKGNQ